VTRVLAVADADSYLKWSAATLDLLPRSWHRRQLLITSPIAPSAKQALAATGNPVQRVSLRQLHRLLRRDPPDVLLLACTGPTVRALAGLRVVRGSRRPVLVTGLPGISVPASTRAVDLRRGCDLLVVHSRRERDDFTRLASERAPGLRIALGRLPFLPAAGRPGGRKRGRDVVFAAQANVPPSRADREAILLALADVPNGSAVVKVRALAGEQQTHHEEHSYAELWAGLVADGRVAEGAVRFRAGSMRAALEQAESLVTVSSTAALEAIDAGVGVVVLSDFGIDAALINLVFTGSGCLGTLADVRAGRAFAPDRSWSTENYFHPIADDDLVSALESLVAARRAGQLADRPRSRSMCSRDGLRALARLVVPASVVGWRRRLQRGR
jgi:hypothetical protein